MFPSILFDGRECINIENKMCLVADAIHRIMLGQSLNALSMLVPAVVFIIVI